MPKNRQPKERNDLSTRARKIKKREKKKEKETILYEGIPCDSENETYFWMWCKDLKNRGYIRKYYRGGNFLLSDAVSNSFVINMKTKSKPGSELILQGHSFNHDAIIEWTNKGLDKFAWIPGKGKKFDKLFYAKEEDGILKSYIEIKSQFDFQNMTRLATLNIKWLYQKYGIFCQIIRPIDLFRKTFTPDEFLKTKSGKKRKLNYQPRSIDNFLYGK